jgi:hypothetical protein
MVFTLDVTDDIARALTGRTERDLPSRALQALAVIGYRDRQLTQEQVGDLLGLSRIQTEDFWRPIQICTMTSRRSGARSATA